ncbi:MAG: tRNA(Ile2) 2-agmatinylcytidine synthetase, partial [Candidatus Caldarchaeum sp.]
TLNIEKLQVIQLARHQIVRPPRCPSCGKRMDSAGFGKGFRCKSCRLRSNKPEITVVERVLRPGFYEVSVSARRHLSKPLCIQDVSPTTNSQ